MKMCPSGFELKLKSYISNSVSAHAPGIAEELSKALISAAFHQSRHDNHA